MKSAASLSWTWTCGTGCTFIRAPLRNNCRTPTLQIAKNIWNSYYAPVFGTKDVVLLAVYSHMIDSFMYLPDYPIGHLIAFQIEEQMKASGAIGPEFERMAKMGRVTPDMWMIHATGKPVGAEALLTATANASRKNQNKLRYSLAAGKIG